MSTTQQKYEIESIVQAAVFWKKRKAIHWKYLVKWKGYSHDENTWEPADSFDTSEALNEFWRITDTNGRDIRNGKLFKVGEEFFPRIVAPNEDKPPLYENIEKAVEIENEVEYIEAGEQIQSIQPERSDLLVTETPKLVDPTPPVSTRKRTRESTGKETPVKRNKRRRSSSEGDKSPPSLDKFNEDILSSKTHNPLKNVEVVITRNSATHAVAKTIIETVNDAAEPEVDAPVDAPSPHHSLFSDDEDEIIELPNPNVLSGVLEQNVNTTTPVQNSGSQLNGPRPPRTRPLIPAHRARKPLVKMVEEPLIQLGPGRALPTKAKLIAKLQGGLTSEIPINEESVIQEDVAASIPADSEVTTQTNDSSSNQIEQTNLSDSSIPADSGVTTQINGSLSNQNEQTSSSDSSTSSGALHMSDLVDESLLGPPEQDSSSSIQCDSAFSELTPLDPVPSGSELLHLAGYDGNIMDDLPDFEQNSSVVTDTDIHFESEIWKMAGPSSLIQPYVGMAANGHSDLLFNPTATETITHCWPSMSNGLFANTEYLGRHTILLPLDPSTSILVKMKKISRSNFGSAFQLDSLLPPACTGPPGKLYNEGVLRHLRTGGSSAQLEEDDIVNTTHKENFRLLRHKLDSGRLLIGVFCGYVLVFCSPHNEAVCEKLRIPDLLLSGTAAILVSHVMIDDDSGFAEFAMQAEELQLRNSF